MKKRKVLSILCAAVMAIGGTFIAFGKEYKNSNKTATVEKAPVADNVVVQEEESNSMSLLTKKISFDDYAKYNVEPLAESAIELTAKVLPVGVVNNGVKWTLSWVNPSSTWAIGNKVDDYLTIVPAYENALTAVVSCKQAFGEQAKITVTSCDDETKTATCTIDYVQKVTDVSLYFGNLKINLGGKTPVKYEIREDVTGPGGEVFSVIKTSSTYTIAETFEESVVFTGEGKLLYNYSEEIYGTYNSRTVGDYVRKPTENLIGQSVHFDYMSDIQYWYANYRTGRLFYKDLTFEALSQRLGSSTLLGQTVYKVKFVLVGVYNTFNYNSEIVYDGFTYTDTITGLSLNQNNLIF